MIYIRQEWGERIVRSNLFKYIFIIFVIGIMVFAVYMFRTGEEEKAQMQQNQEKIEEQTKVREINLGIAEFDTMNPITSHNKNVQDIQRLIYEPLISLSSDYKIEASLATEWAKQGDTSYIIKLRDGVKWSDGTEFTAEDVRFTIDRLKENTSIYSYNVEEVSQVDVVDKLIVKITLDKEVPFFEYNLTFPIVEAIGYSGETIPGGTGRYKISENTDSDMILVKNDNWWGTQTTSLSLEKITITKYANLGEMYNAFKIGNVDVISTDNTNLQEYIGKIGYNEKQIQGREHTFLVLNTQNAFLQSLALRKAIAYSIDKDNVVASVSSNQYYTSSFPMEYGTWIYQAQNSSLGYNPEQAKQELTDDGWTYRRSRGWQKTTTTTTTNERTHRNTKRTTTQRIELNLLVKASDAIKVTVAENIQSQLANQGITVNLIRAGDSQYTTAINNKSYDIALCSIARSPNPSLELYFGENNLANYANEEVTEIMKEVKNTNDDEVLKSDYQKLSEYYKNEIPYISLYSSRHTIVYSGNLSGEFAPNWISSFYGIQTWAK